MAAGAAIPAGGCTIVVTVTSTTPGTVTNTTGTLHDDAGTRARRARRSPCRVAAPSHQDDRARTIPFGGTATLTILPWRNATGRRSR